MKRTKEMTHTEHTPAPWRLNTDTLDIGDYAAIQGSNGTFIGAVWADNTQAPQADAKLIVRAVNSHVAMVLTLYNLIQAWESIDENTLVPDEINIDHLWEDARAALALAEGETP